MNVGKRAVSLVAVLAALAVGNVFAQEEADGAKKPRLVSGGVGGLFGGDFGGGYKLDDDTYTKMPYLGGGFFGFVDAKYAELSLGMLFGSGKIKGAYAGKEFENPDSTSYASFNIGLLGKYPINLGEKFVFFPLFGIDYQLMMLVITDGGKENAIDFSALWFKAGIGGDYALTQKLYLRGEFLYGLRLANKFEKDMAQGDVKTALGHGLNVKVALGWKRF